MKCLSCGKDLGAVILFDSSAGAGCFCEECYREAMREHTENNDGRKVVSR